MKEGGGEGGGEGGREGWREGGKRLYDHGGSDFIHVHTCIVAITALPHRVGLAKYDL